MIGKALKLEGGSSGTGKHQGVNTRDSFTVTAWARLELPDDLVNAEAVACSFAVDNQVDSMAGKGASCGGLADVAFSTTNVANALMYAGSSTERPHSGNMYGFRGNAR